MHPWLVETHAWALREFGPLLSARRALVLPTEAFFPALGRRGPPTAEDIFRCVRRHTGTEGWAVRVEAQSSDEGPLLSLPMGVVLAEPEPAATFRRSFTATGADVITYHPSLVARPQALVAVLGHGLAHHLLTLAHSEPPGGAALWDHATDLVAVALGLGVFLANSSHVVAWEEGVTWYGPSVYCQGWLPQPDVAAALALFCRLHGVAARHVVRHLDRGPRAYFRRAFRVLRGAPGQEAPPQWP